MSLRDDTAWQDDAACLDAGLKVFYPRDLKTQGRGARESAQVKFAKSICATCPVQTACLEYALKHDDRWGIWGGTSPDDRATLRKTS